MKRRKNLERAIVLGLLLSSSVYGSAWAEEEINETITAPLNPDTYQQDVIIDTGDNSAIEIDDDSISITTEDPVENETGKIELNSNKYGIRLDGNGSVTLTAVGDNVITVTANSTNSEIGDGINVTENAGGTITLNGANNTITVSGEHSDGIYTAEGSKTNINLIATSGNNTITATNNGIDHRGNGTITLKAENGNNIIKTTNGDGIRVDGTGDVVLTAKENIINAGDNGIQVAGGGTVSVTATGNNTITANTNGIYVSGENTNAILKADINTINVNGGDNGASGIYVTDGAEKEIISNESTEINVNANAGNVYGIFAENTGKVNISANDYIKINVDCIDNLNDKYTTETYGVFVDTGSEVNLTTTAGDIEIMNNADEKGDGLNANNGMVSTGTVKLDSGKDINIYTYSGGSSADDRVAIENNGTMNLYADGNLNIISENIGDNTNTHINRGIYTNTESSFGAYIDGEVNITSNGASAIGIQSDFGGGSIELKSDKGITVNAIGHGAIDPTGGSMEVDSYAIWNSGNGTVKLETDGEIDIIASNDNKSTDPSYSLVAGVVGLNMDGSNETILDGADVDITSISNGYLTYGVTAQYSKNAKVEIISDKDTNITAETNFGQSYAVSTANGNINIKSDRDSIIKAFRNNEQGEAIAISTEVLGNDYENIIDVESNRNNLIYASNIGVYTDGEYSKVNVKANSGSNLIGAGDISNGYGTSYAINAIGQSDVDLTAGETNLLRGAVYASGSTDTAKTDVTLGGGANMVLSNAYIANAGELADKNVISALYAEKGANISLDGDYNILGTYAVSSSDDLERVVWAYDTADIDITGLTAISTDSYDLATNMEELSADEILGYSGDRANVDINYESDSSITGDILSAYAGTVNIAANTETTRAASDSKIDIRGNLLAGNNGILDVNLGNGGTLTGRADDYGDAGLDTGHGAATGTENSFFNPAFSSEIIANGTVNLTMGEGSVWNVTGQSWITELKTTANAEDTLINLEKAKEDYNTSASALTIGTLKGNTQFYMNLDGDRSASDMLYIKNANGKYDIYLQEEVTTGEINANGFNGLRFATVGEGSNADFTVKSQGTGSAFDVVYTVGTDSYAGNEENTAYNSTTGGNANTEKPGNDSVDNFFGLTNTATEETPEAATNGIMLMAEDEEAADNAANADSGLNEVTNFKIIARAGEELNDTGETILNMSRANYSNAIYMDRLNKRLGEARYINGEEEDGMWVRIRHDRIGKTDAYRSQNTMYELGYDQKQDCDNGERRVGFAVDYMHGDTGYSDIAGKGEIDRYGLWLYDTWMGDKGHYVDYVAKWGHLSNDFEVYTMRNGDKVTGDYSNNVFSVSAEYGRKKDMGNDWYFEPQAQLQLARVTGADYTTNQGTKVSVDGINSLIGRAGFRLGKDFGEEKQSTVYIKADVLHEFLGDQDVYVYDKSSDNKWAGISYENEGTWYDVGFGFATMMSKNSYAFLDLEKSFGHDNDETYQINAGVQWTF